MRLSNVLYEFMLSAYHFSDLILANKKHHWSTLKHWRSQSGMLGARQTSVKRLPRKLQQGAHTKRNSVITNSLDTRIL